MHVSTLHIALVLAGFVSFTATAIWISHPPTDDDPAADAAREELQHRKSP